MIEIKGGVVGVSDRAVFFSTETNLQPQAVSTLGKKEKSQLGEQGRVIEKDKVASVHAAKDAVFTTVITAKGLGDDIGVHAMTEAAQHRIVSMRAGTGWEGWQAGASAARVVATLWQIHFSRCGHPGAHGTFLFHRVVDEQCLGGPFRKTRAQRRAALFRRACFGTCRHAGSRRPDRSALFLQRLQKQQEELGHQQVFVLNRLGWPIEMRQPQSATPLIMARCAL